MASVRNVRVREPGERAERLLDCLRAKADDYKIGVEAGTEGTLMASDRGGSADDLSAFLRAQLDGCAETLGYDWRPYIFVSEPD
jgi:hypothetical protein